MSSKRPCPSMPTCRMYPVFTLASTLQVWKDNYCTSDFDRCERFKKSARGEEVSDLMLPNGMLLKKG